MNHHLTTLVNCYVSEFPELKLAHQDIDALEFNQNFGFQIKVPKSWPVHAAAAEAMSSGDFNHIVVVYSSTGAYNSMLKACEERNDLDLSAIRFFSWHEFYFAMHTANENALNFNRLKESLLHSDCVVFLGSSSAYPEVVTQIKGLCDCCLLLLG